MKKIIVTIMVLVLSFGVFAEIEKEEQIRFIMKTRVKSVLENAEKTIKTIEMVDRTKTSEEELKTIDRAKREIKKQEVYLLEFYSTIDSVEITTNLFDIYVLLEELEEKLILLDIKIKNNYKFIE